jgi:hypothetical protein
VSHDGEQARYLHRNPARNYAHTPFLGARFEPECVDEQEQRQQSAAARRRDLARLRSEWEPRRDAILRELEGFAGIGGITSRLRRDVGVVARSTRRVDKHLDDLGKQVDREGASP